MQREAIENQADDYVTEFCRRHPSCNPEVLREELAAGPRWVRAYLATLGILNDFPRRPRSAVQQDGGVIRAN